MLNLSISFSALGIYLAIYYYTSSSSLRIISQLEANICYFFLLIMYLEFWVLELSIKSGFQIKYLNENADFQCNLDHMTLNENTVQMLF